MKRKKKTLITAPIPILFPKKKTETVFLEDWFKLENLKFNHKTPEEILSSLSNKWSVKKKRSDYFYIIKKYEKFLTILKLILNKLHQENFSKKYWEQVYGMWLIDFLVSIYEKYDNIIRLKNISNFNTYSLNQNIYIPRNTREAKKFYLSSQWFHYIYIKLIQDLKKKIVIKKINNYKLKDFDIQNKKKKISLKTLLKDFFSSITCKVTSKNELFIITTYLPFFKEILLQFRVNKIFKINLPYEHRYNYKKKINYNLRNKKIAIKKGDDAFDQFIKKNILKNLPSIFLEEFREIRNYNLKLPWKKNPKKIYTSTSASNDDIFKIWLAEQKENGSKLIFGQHGTQFLFKFCTFDYYYKKISDRVLSWGDKIGDKKKFFPFANIKNISKKIEIKKDKYLFLIQETPQKSNYNGRIHSALLLNDYKKYIELQNRFLNNLTEKTYKKIKVRLGSNLRHTSTNNLLKFEKNIWSYYHPKLTYEIRNQNIYKTLEKSYLTILTTISATLVLECISFNIPFVILTLEYKNVFSKKAYKDFSELEKNKILFRNPKKLSDFLNTKNAAQIREWWYSEKIQNLIKKFQKNYSKNSDNFLGDLKKILRTKI